MARVPFIILGGTWAVRPVAEQPSVTLVRWRVIEVEGGERHFVGYNLDDQEGRVSSRIESFDPATGKGITSSGRIYRLLGDCGHDQDAEYVWRRWVSINSVTLEKDVSLEIAELMQVANSKPLF